MTNIDKIAIGAIVRIGGELHKKVSPMICKSLQTGQLLYDARLYAQWKDSPPPMVEYVGRNSYIV